MEAALFQETLHPQFNARRLPHVLAFITVDLGGWRQGIAAFILVNQSVDIAVADRIHHLHQIADRPGIDRKAKFDLRGHFITVSHCDFTHIVAEAADF